MDWRIYGAVIAAVTIIAFCAIGGGYQTRRVSAGWTKPSWHQNPFEFRSQPLQFLHFGAISAIAEGVGVFLRSVTIGQGERTFLPSLSFAVGLGIWIALRLCVMLFHADS